MPKDKDRLIQECLGLECPFLENFEACLHGIDIDGIQVCMIGHQQKTHSYDEIARIMGITRQAVMYLEKKALEKMKANIERQLKKEGLTIRDILS